MYVSYLWCLGPAGGPAQARWAAESIETRGFYGNFDNPHKILSELQFPVSLHQSTTISLPTVINLFLFGLLLLESHSFPPAWQLHVQNLLSRISSIPKPSYPCLSTFVSILFNLS